MAESTISAWGDEDRSRVGELTEEVKGRVTQARSELEGFDRQFRAFVKERPFVALFGAIAAGYLVARLVSRR
jgi:ElaB/YqjD/DUF883 family membrane-anchored ribosome-binding protein